MAFTGKATYSAGSTLPEIAEDVSDLIGISSPHETPLLDALGDPARSAQATLHEWLEDTLVANTDLVADVASATSWVFVSAAKFRVGDLVRIDATGEIALVTAANYTTNTLTVTRGYGETTSGDFVDGDAVTILGNAALEGDDASVVRFTSRTRQKNYTQIFSSTVEISGSELAVRKIGVRDELDYQKAQRTRELLRDLENTVINGVLPDANPEGSATVRRTMRGILSFIDTNVMTQGEGDVPESEFLTEEILNLALRTIWQRSGAGVDLIVVNGREKRRINAFVATNRRYFSVNESFKDMVSSYESDFGNCRVVVSRHVPLGSVLLLDSSRISVMPLAGRSFHYRQLATTGDREAGQMLGEYTLEFRNESAHGVINGFTA
ncbi:MAG TPA: DUF5309 family protein [Tepidisphaeraceae bacterium]|nr:DUF5309 family protein [Tepidisphaeraceae bacterium]